jgi:signal transduction histidine kinase
MRTILEEAERLNRFIGNLLDMTRLESGPLTQNVVPSDLRQPARNTAFISKATPAMMNLCSGSRRVLSRQATSFLLTFSILKAVHAGEKKSHTLQTHGIKMLLCCVA